MWHCFVCHLLISFFPLFLWEHINTREAISYPISVASSVLHQSTLTCVIVLVAQWRTEACECPGPWFWCMQGTNVLILISLYNVFIGCSCQVDARGRHLVGMSPSVSYCSNRNRTEAVNKAVKVLVPANTSECTGLCYTRECPRAMGKLMFRLYYECHYSTPLK